MKTKSRGNPTVQLGDGHDILTPYVGPRELRTALEKNQAEPLNLASADFDEDGTPDLVTGYSFAGRGIVTLMRGNVDAIYPNAPAAKQRRASGTFTHAPFLSPAYVFSTPVAAEFIAAGDFDGDSHWDVIVASSNSAALYLLAGNGKGEFPTVKKMALPGLVTALTAGETNRRDGLTDVIVGIGATAKPQVLVFEGPSGAFNSTPEVFPMPSRVASLALGQLDDSYEIDLLVAAGSELILVHGRDRQLLTEPDERVRVPAPHLERRSFPGAIRDLTLGDFKAQQKLNAAVMMENGNVQLLDAGAAAGAPLAEWKIETLERNWGNANKIITAKVSSLPGDDLLVSDTEGSSIQIVRSAPTKLKTQMSASDRGFLSTIEGVDTAPIAILPMRLNEDAFSDLTMVKRGRVSASVLTTQASQTLVVTNTNDSGPGSLRQAVLDSEQNAGAVDTIIFQIGSGPQTIALQSALPLIGDPVTIDATTQPGYAGQPIIELDGTNCTPDFPAFAIFGGHSLIRGFVINRFQSNGLNISEGPGNIVEGNYFGTDKTGTIALPNRNRGLEIGEAPDRSRSSNNLIGGTTAQARNLISGNKVHGLRILNSLSTNNVIQGNYIGTDVTGTKPLGNFFEGIYIGGGNNNTVGGTTAGARNLVSANGFEGTGRTAGLAISTFPLQVGASGNIVQGNYIGTNATGTAALGNGHEGLLLEDGATSNLVGGTTAAARNLISGNNTNGVDVGFSKPVTLNQILGNYIGTDVTGEVALGNVLHGIFINVNSVDNIIRDNRIAFNGGAGVFIPNVTPDPGAPGVRIAIDTNEIYANKGLGIDLGEAGVTANDPLDTDVGANLQQNFPVLTSAVASLFGESIWERMGEVGREMPDPMLAAALTINGTLNSTPNATFTVHWYFSNDAQCTTNQAASRPLAFGRVPNVMTNSNGDAQFFFDFDFPAGTTGGVINCTATDAQGNTSEFSSCFSVSTPARTLTVASSNPASGVDINVSPSDNSSQGNGTTQFTRTYNHNTVVSLTAPATVSGNNFQKWLKDGADFANNTVANVSVTMDANHTMTAVYVTPARTLTVASSNPASGVDINVSPNDNGSQGNGTTQFTRTYNHNTVVSLTAPATAGGNNFQKWLKDGADFANNTVTNVSVTMDANHTMTAVYVTPVWTLTVASSNPANGVDINVSPNDNSSQGNGTTQFTRTYNNNTVVSVTAPATASGNNFQKWLKDGADFANNTVANVSVTMDANHTMTAVYVTPGPMIFVEAGTNNLAAVDSVSRVRGPFVLTNTSNFSSDQRTRIIFYTADLGFAQTAQPDINTLSVQVGGNSYPVETVGPNTTTGGSEIIFRLPDLAPGTYPLGIRVGGVNSGNTPNLTIIASGSSTASALKSNQFKLAEYLLFPLVDLIF